MRPLLDLCVGARAREGAKVTLRWWEQAGIDWEKAKVKGTETETTARTETGTDTEGEGGAGGRKQGKWIKRGGMERGECG